jgi:outer membrane protein OmpA-like peptidoglycan-associated protein
MKRLAIGGIAFLFFVCFAVLCPAQDAQFQNTAQEIIDALTRQAPKTVRTRGIRGYKPELQQRCIMVQEKKDDQVVEKQIIVSESEDLPCVNLKVEFDFDSYAIRPDSYYLLGELGEALKDSRVKNKPVMIIGHTDSDGSEQYNLSLSLNRALAVKHYLVGSFGIDEYQLRTIGYGEAMPLVFNTSPENKQKNRRVEVRLDEGAW